MSSTQSSPPPPRGLSRASGMVERMYGGAESARFMQLGELADAAGVDPAMCVAVVQALRAVRDQLLVSEALDELHQHSTLFTGQVGIGNDSGFEVRDLGSSDGHPSQVA